MTVYPDPTQLGSPVRVVKDLKGPYGIASNSRGEMIVSEPVMVIKCLCLMSEDGGFGHLGPVVTDQSR